MAERVVLDFSRVEAALDETVRQRRIAVDRQNAVVSNQRSKARARTIKYCAGGAALVICSIGFAFWLGMQWARPQIVGTSSSGEALERLLVVLQKHKDSPPNTTEVTAANKIVSHITLFNSIDRSSLPTGLPYLAGLVAGHKYSNSNAEHWEHAYCYAEFIKNGLTLHVQLATRQGKGLLVPNPVTQTEGQELGLTSSDLASLRARCPWRESS